jgi:hypothetical protein
MPASMPMGQFLMATIPSPRTICEWVSFEQASYIHHWSRFRVQLYSHLLNLEMWYIAYCFYQDSFFTGAIILNPVYCIAIMLQRLRTLYPQTIPLIFHCTIPQIFGALHLSPLQTIHIMWL